MAAGCQNGSENTPQVTSAKAAITATNNTGAAALTLSSASFAAGGRIPSEQACARQGGANRSPQLSWQGAPAGTASFAVIMDDEDCGAGDRACRHWSVFNIPLNVTSLKAGEDPGAIDGVTQGSNYLGKEGYAGPCPPSQHTYRITVFALDGGAPRVDKGAEMNRAKFQSKYGQHILGSATIAGTYP